MNESIGAGNISFFGINVRMKSFGLIGLVG